MLANQLISPCEIRKAVNGGMRVLADLSIRTAERRLYSADNSFCEGGIDETKRLCLYLYIYAAEDWCANVDNTFTVHQLMGVVAKIEELTGIVYRPQPQTI